MLSALKPLLDIWKWVINLPKDKIIYFLFSLGITLLLYENFNLREENERLNSRIDFRDDRADSIRNILEKRVQDCEAQRTNDAKAFNEYWSKKYEKLEERLYKDFETVKEIKSKR